MGFQVGGFNIRQVHPILILIQALKAPLRWKNNRAWQLPHGG
jgi:hypothetical protein